MCFHPHRTSSSQRPPFSTKRILPHGSTSVPPAYACLYEVSSVAVPLSFCARQYRVATCKKMSFFLLVSPSSTLHPSLTAADAFRRLRIPLAPCLMRRVFPHQAPSRGFSVYAGVSSRARRLECAPCLLTARVMALFAVPWLMPPELAKVHPIQAEIARPRQYIHSLHPCTHHTFKAQAGLSVHSRGRSPVAHNVAVKEVGARAIARV